MTPRKEFQRQPKAFWANIRLISQHVGYTQRKPPARRPRGADGKAPRTAEIKAPTLHEIAEAYRDLDLRMDHLIAAPGSPTPFGKLVLEYFKYRADVLRRTVRPSLMKKDDAKQLFEKLHRDLCPSCPLPLNKQKGAKRAPAYFTGIINMIIEANAKGMPCDYDPRELTTITRDGRPFRTLARRVDGAFPGPVDPIAVWEIKEYYYTTTFGSRVADGVYESLLDGMELEELRLEGQDVKHYLMIDDYFTWWECGRSYLCRLVDILHMGYVDEILVGREVAARLPTIVRGWVKDAKKRGKS